jgi:hypothetical protein
MYKISLISFLENKKTAVKNSSWFKRERYLQTPLVIP